MKKRAFSKLEIQRETLRRLDGDRLRMAAAGVRDDDFSSFDWSCCITNPIFPCTQAN